MGLLTMNERERLAKAMMEMVAQGKIKLVAAAIQLDVGYRQVKRIYKRYIVEGDAGLVHKARGRASSRKHPHQEAIIARYKERYEGFGPTLAAEYLSEEDGLNIDHETLRRLLLSEGLWCKQRTRSPYRRQRQRREQFGELVQVDGSIHDWLEEGRHRCLLNMVDDATGKTLSILASGETTRVVLMTLWKWITSYGIPLALYVDFKNVYVSTKNTNHVERACAKLGIRIIKAHSPQAKGRVERNHAVYQDRFVKELRLKNAKTVDDANKVLENGFIDKLNRKFEKPAINLQSAHRPASEYDLNQALCWEYERQMQHDWTVSFKNKCYQIKKPYGCSLKPKMNICIRKHLDDSISIWHGNQKLSFTVLDEKPKPVKIVAPDKIAISMSERGRMGRQKSSWDSSNREIFIRLNNSNEKYVSNFNRISRQFAGRTKMG